MIIFANEVKKEDLNNKLIRRLELLDIYIESDVIVTSGLRTPEKNAEVGGSKTSSHLKGLASDIACDSWSKVWDIINNGIKAGFVRFGIAKDHVHVDVDPDKKQNVIWIE